ncbi:conjugal transfer protein TraG N-terminal domain-containing protein [Ursidibacter arcticus]
MALDIITIGGIDIVAQMFTAVATLTSNRSFFNLMGVAEILGVAACVFSYIKTKDIQKMGIWLLFFVMINGLLLTPKVDLLVTDRTTPKVKKVDNVPIGVAVPFYLFSLSGNALAEMYDTFLAQPNDVQYTRTGMLFGQRLLDRSFNTTSRNVQFESNLSNFTKSCIVPDIEINHKYSYQDFYNSESLFDFFLNNPKFRHSENRHMYLQNGATGDYVTCLAGAKKLKDELNKITQLKLSNNPKKNEKYLIDPSNAPQNVTQGVYGFLMNNSKNAAEIYKQNILVNSLRRNMDNLPASFDSTADMIAITSEQSLLRSRLANHSSYQIATKTIPSLYTVFSTLLVGIFPIIILAMFVTEMTLAIIKSYLGFLFSLMLYPVLFAIFNSIINTLTYQQLGGEAFTLSNADTLKANLSDIGGTAGYLMLSIPFISFGLIKGLGQAVSSAGSYLGNALSSITTADASQVSMGNYNFRNMQMENINGFKTDLNSVFRAGNQTVQNANGTETTIAADGSYIHNAKTGMSNLATNINWNQVKQTTFGNEDRATHEQRQSFERASVQSESAARSYLNEVISGHNHSHTLGNNKTGGLNKTHSEVIGNTTTAGENKNISTDQTTNKSVGDSEQAQGAMRGSLGIGGKGILGFGGDASYTTGSSESASVSDAQAKRIAQEASDIMRKTGDVNQAYQYLSQNINNVQDSAYYNQLNRAATEFRNANEYRETASNLEAKSKAYAVYANESDAQSVAINRQLDQRFAEHLATKYGVERANAILDPNPTKENEMLIESEAKAVVRQYYDEIASTRLLGASQVSASYGAMSVNGSTQVGVDSSPDTPSSPSVGRFEHHSVSPNSRNQDASLGTPENIERVIDGKQQQFSNEYSSRQEKIARAESEAQASYEKGKSEYGTGVKNAKAAIQVVEDGAKTVSDQIEKINEIQRKNPNGW